jgi:hypothetical protein
MFHSFETFAKIFPVGEAHGNIATEELLAQICYVYCRKITSNRPSDW